MLENLLRNEAPHPTETDELHLNQLRARTVAKEVDLQAAPSFRQRNEMSNGNKYNQACINTVDYLITVNIPAIDLLI